MPSVSELQRKPLATETAKKVAWPLRIRAWSVWVPFTRGLATFTLLSLMRVPALACTFYAHLGPEEQNIPAVRQLF